MLNFDNFLNKSQEWKHILYKMKLVCDDIDISFGNHATNYAHKDISLESLYQEQLTTFYKGLLEHNSWHYSKSDLEIYIKKNLTFKNYEDNFNDIDGSVDYFMYRMLGDDVEIGGYNLKENQDEYDNVIRYEYGYQDYEYGRLWILQSYKSIDEFVNHTYEVYMKSIENGDEIINGSKFLSNLSDDNLLSILRRLKKFNNEIFKEGESRENEEIDVIIAAAKFGLL